MNTKYNFHNGIIEYFSGLNFVSENYYEINLSQNYIWSSYRMTFQEISRLIFGKNQFFVGSW